MDPCDNMEMDEQVVEVEEKPAEKPPVRTRTKTRLYQSEEEEAKEREQRRSKEKQQSRSQPQTENASQQAERECHDWKQGERMGEAKNPGPGYRQWDLPYPTNRQAVGRRRQERRKPGFRWMGWQTHPLVPPHRIGTQNAQSYVQMGGARRPGVPTRPAQNQHWHVHANSGPALYDGSKRLTPGQGRFGNHSKFSKFSNSLVGQLQHLQERVQRLQGALDKRNAMTHGLGRGHPPTYAQVVRWPACPREMMTTGAPDLRQPRPQGKTGGGKDFWTGLGKREPNLSLGGMGKGWG